MQNLKTITIKNYLTQKDILFKETNGELITTCVFCDKKNHLYFNAKTGQYDCKVCGEKGNIFTLAEHLGDDKKDILLNQIQNKNKGTKNNAIFYTELANTCNEAMPNYIRQYLNQRGINDKSIFQFKLGYNKFYGKQWITIPIVDNNGDIIFFKLRQDPREGNDKTTFKKNKTDKITAQIYDWKTLKNSTDKIVICEGELDKILLQSKGIPSITSSHGALTFKDEWIKHFEHFKKVYLCFDLDNTGKEATKKIVKQLSKVEDLQIHIITLPTELGSGGDITDYFIKLKGSAKDLLEKYATEINLLANTNRVAKIETPKQKITIDQWRNTIKKHFPELLFSAEIGLSVMAQILIKDITNPFALVLVGMPSSGKTICLNFFSEIEHLTYASDKFTPASFVSNAVNRTKKELKKIDLLPRLQYKMLLIKDLATLFSKRDDDLNECLGTLTRVLDGEGLSTDGGVHGQRKYVGEYLFMLMAASTPIPPKVWKIMGNLGSRLFFLNVDPKDKSIEELSAQLKSKTCKKKETECRLATKYFLQSLWNKYPNGIDWNSPKDEEENMLIIARCAKLLSQLRGTVNAWKEATYEGHSHNFGYSMPIIEKPDRINQLLYNLCRGHAVICGDNQITKQGLKQIIGITLDSTQYTRAKIFRELLENNGVLNTASIQILLNCSKPTAIKEMKVLEILKIIRQKRESNNQAGEPQITIYLTDEFKWFLSDEYKKIMGLPIVPKQSTVF